MIAKIVLLLAVIIIADTVCLASQVEWNPYRENEFETKKGATTRSYVQGSKLEMGEVVAISGNKSWIMSDAAKGKRIEVRVGDKIFMGSDLITDNATTVELLLGFNARLRLGKGTEIKMDNIVMNEDKDMSFTTRKIVLRKGTVRARVKQNIVTPTPVLVISASAEMSVGLPDLAVQGGVDILVEKDKSKKEAVVKVLNGSIKMERKGGMLSQNDETIVEKGLIQRVIPVGNPLPESDHMAKLDMLKVMKNYAFTTESWGQINEPPTGYNNELDGP
ncbi:MAG: FecR family protein [Planctomycetota bacterium]|jgi:hypothetical protein